MRVSRLLNRDTLGTKDMPVTNEWSDSRQAIGNEIFLTGRVLLFTLARIIAVIRI